MLGQELMQAVGDLVKAAETQGGTGESKFAYVLNRIKDDFPAASKLAGEQLLNVLIEAAVSSLPLII